MTIMLSGFMQTEGIRAVMQITEKQKQAWQSVTALQDLSNFWEVLSYTMQVRTMDMTDMKTEVL